MSYIEKEPLLEKAKSLQGNLFGAVAIVREIEKSKTIDEIEIIKEFAERLKNATMPVTLGGKYKYEVITKEGIDNLVKEKEQQTIVKIQQK